VAPIEKREQLFWVGGEMILALRWLSGAKGVKVSGSDFLAEAKRGEATILGTQQAAKDRAQKLLLVRL